MKRPSLPPSRTPDGSPAARLLLALMLAGATQSLHAASQTWSPTPTDANWATAANWVGAAAPGAVSANTTDVATFNSSLSGGTVGGSTDPIIIDAGRTIGAITFDTANVGSYQIGSNAGNVLRVGSNSTTSTIGIKMTSTANASQVIAAPLQLAAFASSTNPQYTFSNDSANNAATLSFTGAITANISASRPTKLILAGSNTGNNIISGNLSNPSFAQGVATLTKNGTGTWILSGNNTFSGTAVTGLNAANGIQINAGVLVAQNNNALGSTTGSVNNYINNGGTLELDAGGVNGAITLNNALTLQLNSGGTLRSRGSNTTASTVKVSTAGTVTSTLSTVNSGDVFTIGNAANDLTGGAADSVIKIAGPGTVLLGQASNYAGGFSIDSGTLKLGNATALGSAPAIAFGAGSTGTLSLNGNSATVASLSSNATVGTPVIENNSVTASTLTVSNTSGSTAYAGVIQDGSAGGALGLVKTGASTLSLTGASTYTGGTTISGGTLSANGSSALGTGLVTVGSGATLAANTLTLGNLTLAGGANILLTNFDSTITSTGTVDISGASNLLSVGGSVGVAGNTYTLLSANSLSASGLSLSGTAVSGLTIALGDTGTIGRTNFAFTSTLTSLQLSVTGGAFNLTWNGGNANWNATDANWQKDGTGSNIAFFAGDNITLATGDTIAVDAGGITAGSLAVTNTSGTATLNGGNLSAVSLTKTGAGSLVANNAITTIGGVNVQAGSVALNAANTISGAITVSGGTLTLGANDAAGSGAATLTVSGGQLDLGASNQSLTNVTLTSGSITGTTGVLTATGNAIDAQSGDVSAILGGTVGLTKSTAGTVVLSGENTYTGATTISAGTLQIGNGGTTGSISNTSGVTNSGTLTYNRSNDHTVGYVISGTGAVVKDGAGTLTLTNANTYSGATTINSGTLQIGNGGTTGAITNSSITNNATLAFNRSDTVNVTGISGTGVVLQNGSGILNVTGANSYAGGTTVNAGTLQVFAGGSVAGTIDFKNGSTFRLQNNGGTSSFVGNNATVAAGATTTFVSSVTSNGYSGNLTSGDANSVILVTGGANAFNFSASGVKQFTNFNGTVNVVAGSSMDARGNTHNNGGDNTTFQIDGFVGSKNAGTWTFGALTGSTTGNLGGVNTYNVGAKNINTTYDGIISSTGATALVKTGTGSLTLTGAHTYTGATSVTGGLLVVNGSLANTAVTVGALGTLGGSGTIGGATVVNGALNPGTSPGVITFSSDLTLAGTTNLELNTAVRGTGHDGVNIGNNLTYGGALNLVFGSTFLTGGELFELFNALDGISDPVATSGSFTAIELQGAYTGTLVNNSGIWTGTTGGLDFTFTQASGELSVLLAGAIPEPSTSAFLAGLVILGFAGLRRRRA